jgi:glycerophosphoryl diester phosphodiesterase
MFRKVEPFIVLGHRGSSLLWPENTLDAFQKALDAGANGFELDVMVTKDNVAVLFHDPNLKRLHGMDVWVEDCTYEELRNMLKGKQQVCTLQEALALADEKRVWVDIEIKTTKWLTAKRVVAQFTPDRKIISSFRHDIISEWRQLDKGKYLFAYIYQHYPRDISNYLEDVEVLKPEQSFVDERYLPVAERVLPWAVNDKSAAMNLRESGFMGVISDFPGLLEDETQIGQYLGYVLSAVKNIQKTDNGVLMELMNTLAPVQINSIKADVNVETTPSLPVFWNVGEKLSILIKGNPTYLDINTSYTGLIHVPFSELSEWLQNNI